MKTFTIIRHGITEGIEKGKLQGSTNSPLSQRGRKQAEITAHFLSSCQIEACFCSPLGRARETAEIICQPLNLTPVILNDLREYDFGWLEGHRFFRPPKEDSSIYIKLKSLMRLTLASLTGETLAHIRSRALKTWHYFLDQNIDGECLVISHGFFMNIFIQEIMKEAGLPKAGIFDASACSLTTLRIEDGIPFLLEVNNISHLGEWSGHGN
jgi:phosphoserine phosphatase